MSAFDGLLPYIKAEDRELASRLFPLFSPPVYTSHMPDKTSDSAGEKAVQLISLTEAAEISGLSHSHLRRLVRDGKIWGTKIGRDWLTTEKAVQNYLSTERRPGPKPKEG